MSPTPSAASSKNDCPTTLSARKDLLWIGGDVPKPLIKAYMVGDIRPIPAATDELEAAAATSRGLLIEVSQDMADLDWASGLISSARNHGLIVIFTIPDLPYDDCPPARFHCYNLAASLDKDGDVHARYNDWEKVVELAAKHDPKGGCNRDLCIVPDAPLPPAAEILIRRAFHDYAGIRLTTIQGGRSGAGVWLARPSNIDRLRRAAPFLIKWNSLEKTRSERSSCLLHAANTVSFRLTPPLHLARCIEGSDTALLVFDFIDRALPFTTAIQHYPAGQLIGSLFDHTLAGCLASATDTSSCPVDTFERTSRLLKK
jgi:hypothetical protein